MRRYEHLLVQGAAQAISTLAEPLPELSDDVWATVVSAHVLSAAECSESTVVTQLRNVQRATKESGAIDGWVEEVCADFRAAVDEHEGLGSPDVLDALVEVACLNESVGEAARGAISQTIARYAMDVGEYPPLFYPLRERAELWVECLGSGERVVVSELLLPFSRLQLGSIEEAASAESIAQFVGATPVDNVVDLMAWAERFRPTPGGQRIAESLNDGFRQAAAAEEDVNFISIKQPIATGDGWSLSVQYTYREIYMLYEGPKPNCPTSVGLGSRYFRVHDTQDDEHHRTKWWVGYGEPGELWAEFAEGSVVAEVEYDHSIFRLMGDEPN